MKPNCQKLSTVLKVFGVLGIGLFTHAHAHDAGNLNEITIDRTNDTVAEKVLAVQVRLTESIRGSRGESTWPDPELLNMADYLKHLQEDLDLSLEYFANQGINLQSKEALLGNPVAARTVAARRAIETSVALLEHLVTLGSEDAFVEEIYGRGLSYYMYDLLGAYRDKLALVTQSCEPPVPDQ